MKIKREITNREAMHIYKNIWCLEELEFDYKEARHEQKS